MSIQKFMTYLCSSGIDDICHFILVPWLVAFVSHCINDNWIRAINYYGLVASSLGLGRVLGWILSIFLYQPKPRIPLLIIMIGLIGLSMSTRLQLISVCAASIGFGGALIGTKDISFSVPKLHSDNLDSNGKLIASSSAEIRQDVITQRKIIVFIFTILVSGTLYEHESLFPNATPCLLAAAWCLFIYIARTAQHIATKERLNIQRNKRKSLAYKTLPNGDELVNKAAIDLESKGQLSTASKHNVDPSSISLVNIPVGFIELHSGNIENARKAYAKTLEWRADNGLDDILTTHQSHFEDILRLYPHAIHGKSKDGVAVLYELIGKARPKEMSKIGITSDSLAWHFILRNEFVFNAMADRQQAPSSSSTVGGHGNRAGVRKENKGNQLYNRPLQRQQSQIMTIIDVKGISISDVNSDVISFIKKSSEIMDNHYPGRVKRLVICNAPMWFHSTWSIVSRVLPESVKKKIAIMGGTQGLQEFIDISQLPQEYGGSGGLLGKSPEHLAFERLPEKWITSDQQKTTTPLKNTSSSPPQVLNSQQQSSSRFGIFSNLAEESDTSSDDDNNYYDNNSNSVLYRPTSSTVSTVETTTKSQWNNRLKENKLIEVEEVMGYEDEDGLLYEVVEEDHDNENKSSTNGIFGWIQSKLISKNVAPAKAYLGEKNLYVYDQHTQTWVLQGITQSMRGDLTTSSKSAYLSEKEREEEQGLVQAIQAAHEASRNAREGGPVPKSFQQFGGSGGARDKNTSRSYTSSGMTASSTDGFNSSIPSVKSTCDESSRDNKASVVVFLFVLVIHATMSFLDTGLATLLPVWMATPISRGGLGYSVTNTCSVMSTAGAIVFVVHSVFKARMAYVLKSSPVRALRVGCGALVCICFLTPWILWIQPRPLEPLPSPVLPVSAMTPHEERDVHFNPFDSTLPLLPLASLPFPAVLIASLVIFSYLSRRASSILLHITHPAVTPPLLPAYTGLLVLTAVVNISGPMLSCWMYTHNYERYLPFPMDSSFFLALCGVACLGVYLSSLLIAIEFKGDFGVLSDETPHLQTDRAFKLTSGSMIQHRQNFSSMFGSSSGSSNSSTLGFMNKLTATRSIPSSTNRISGATNKQQQFVHSQLRSMTDLSSSANGMSAWPLSVSEVLEVPRGDLSLLFDSPVTGYGTKLHNVKIGLKEV